MAELFSDSPKAKAIGCLKRARLVDYGATEFKVQPFNSEGDVVHLGGVFPWRDDLWEDLLNWVSARLDFSISLDEIPALEALTCYYVHWNHSTNDTDYSVLLLIELADENMGRFRRIGIVLSRMETLDAYLDLQPDESDLTCSNYDPNTREHTISIICQWCVWVKDKGIFLLIHHLHYFHISRFNSLHYQRHSEFFQTKLPFLASI